MLAHLLVLAAGGQHIAAVGHCAAIDGPCNPPTTGPTQHQVRRHAALTKHVHTPCCTSACTPCSTALLLVGTRPCMPATCLCGRPSCCPPASSAACPTAGCRGPHPQTPPWAAKTGQGRAIQFVLEELGPERGLWHWQRCASQTELPPLSLPPQLTWSAMAATPLTPPMVEMYCPQHFSWSMFHRLQDLSSQAAISWWSPGSTCSHSTARPACRSRGQLLIPDDAGMPHAGHMLLATNCQRQWHAPIAYDEWLRCQAGERSGNGWLGLPAGR